MKKSLIKLSALLLLPLSGTALPLIGGNTTTPEYLSVPEFKSCLDTEAVQDAELWCLPKNKPSNCPDESWSKLQTVNLVPCLPKATEQMPGIALKGNGEDLV